MDAWLLFKLVPFNIFISDTDGGTTVIILNWLMEAPQPASSRGLKEASHLVLLPATFILFQI